jgi:F0F1-type ATP synthase membrane subunit a
MIVGNLIDVYLFGLIAVMISWLLVLGSFGLVLGGFLLYFFLTDVEVFLCLLFLLELFSSVFQSVTLANRLSINLIAGSLLTSLLSLAVTVFLYYSLYYWIVISFCLFSIYTFELLNCYIQLFIFSLLSLEYLLLIMCLSVSVSDWYYYLCYLMYT